MLAEQYRPKTWAEVVGQEKIVQRIQALAKRGLAGRAYWLSGGSGQGKTTIARLVAAEVADALFTRELDAAALTVSELQELEREMHICSSGDEEMYDYWLDVLPAVYMGRLVTLPNGQRVRADFGFAEGIERITAFWHSAGRCFGCQTTQLNKG